MIFLHLLGLFLLSYTTPCKGSCERLFNDLLTVEAIDHRLNETMPLYYNNLLQGGYWAMPSSRMGGEGELAIGYAITPPYRLWNFRCQLTSHLELSGNYRIFNGIKDPVLSKYGFGNYSDKGVNAKIALILPEESDYRLPGVAIGFEDFLGTCAFKARYIVATKLFRSRHLELSIGVGAQRIKGWFCGAQWLPFAGESVSYLSQLALSAEYDATPYKSKQIEPHPRGRKKRSPFNFGIKYRLGSYLDLSASFLRGTTLGCSISAFYQFGSSNGLLPKVDTPLPYSAPCNREPLGPLRPGSILSHDLFYAYRRHGFDLLELSLEKNSEPCKTLRLRIANNRYRNESDVRKQLNNLVAFLTPANIDRAIIAIDCEGLLIQEYRYHMEAIRRYARKEIDSYCLKLLSPLREADCPCDDAQTSWLLFEKPRPLHSFALLPKSYSCFGSAKGKFKYALGIAPTLSGYTSRSLYYSITLGYIFWQNIDKLGTIDRLNPSQIINVRSDIIAYYQQKGLTIDEAYFQKVWRFQNNIYGRLSTGYFEIEYGGLGGELLYYPLDNLWAIGVEGALLRKRALGSLFNFTDKVRQLNGFKPKWRHFPIATQWFLNTYCYLPSAQINMKISLGKFLANDYGARYELSRYFPSGMRISLWYTHSNGRDKINGRTYCDQGIAFTLPMDFFYTRSDRALWHDSLSAWLRDVGASAYTGTSLYHLIHEQR